MRKDEFKYCLKKIQGKKLKEIGNMKWIKVL